MIKLKDLLVESENILSSKQWKDTTNMLRKRYDSINRMEHDKDYRGEFIRVVFYDYSEAFDFYNQGWELLDKLKIDAQRTQYGGPKNWLGGSLFVVSHRVLDL